MVVPVAWWDSWQRRELEKTETNAEGCCSEIFPRFKEIKGIGETELRPLLPNDSFVHSVWEAIWSQLLALEFCPVLHCSWNKCVYPGNLLIKGKKIGLQGWARVGSCFPTKLGASPTVLRTVLAFPGASSPQLLPSLLWESGQAHSHVHIPKIICLGKKGISFNHKDSNLSCKFATLSGAAEHVGIA